MLAGRVPQARIDDMARRVVRALYATGAADNPVTEGEPTNYAADEAVSQADAEQAIVLLKNEGNLLPLGPSVRRIVVIGGHADKGVLAGSGSSLVYPRGGNAVPGLEPTGWPGPVTYYPSSPVEALRALAPNASITFVDGSNPAAAAAAARAGRRCDRVRHAMVERIDRRADGARRRSGCADRRRCRQPILAPWSCWKPTRAWRCRGPRVCPRSWRPGIRARRAERPSPTC